MTNKELAKKVEELTSLVASVVDKLPKVETKVEAKTGNGILPLDKKIERMLGGASDPIPSDYRKAVDEVLGAEFDVHVKANTGLPAFRFTVIVPSKYSNVKEYDLYPDVRTKVITYAGGLNEVKDWCERVAKTFDNAVMQQIVANRQGYPQAQV